MDEISSRTQLFVCYSHDDAEIVLADVAWLRSLDIAAWHDRRIHGGSTWADEVASAIDASAALVFFVSRHSLVSAHCLNEIAYAVDANKPIVAVFLEPVEVSGGLKLFIGRTQAIVRGQLGVDEYRQEMRHVLEGHLRAPVLSTALPTARFWRVPLRRNARFTGRASLLAELARAFAARDALPVVLTGLPGVGKSQAALEFVYRHADDYRFVAWLRAEEAATLNADFMHLASGLGVVGAKDPDPRVIVDATKRWLASHDHWLLVLDNAEDPALIASYLPERFSGHVLITSKLRTWGKWARRVDVVAFEEEEAIDFLCTHTSGANREDAATLASVLGRLPLALEEAAAYMEATGRTMASYQQLFHRHHDVLMSRMHVSDDYPSTLRTAFEVSLRQVEAEEPRAVQLLRVLAFVAPDDIPNALWERDFAGAATGGGDALLVDRCLASLRKFSLVNVQGDVTSLHRLVQLVNRDRMSPEERRDAISQVLVLIERAFPHVKDMGNQGPEGHRYLPHAMAALTHAEELDIKNVAAGALWGRTGTFLSAYNASIEAAAHLEKAYHIFKSDASHRRLFARTSELYARVLYNNGDLLRSEEVYGEAVAAYQSTEGENTIRLMQVHLDLAWVHWTLGNPVQALRDADRCLDVLRAAAGADDPRAVAGMSIRARIFIEQGLIAEAHREVDASIAAIEALGGFRMPLMCAVFLQLAQVLQDLGFPLRARSWAQEALNLGKNAFSEHHTLIAGSRCVLGQALVTLGELDLAKSEFEAVTESVRRAECPLNQHICIAAVYLGLVMLERGDFDASREQLDESERIVRSRIAGDDSLARAYLSVARSRLAQKSEEFDVAVDELEHANGVIERRYGVQHPYRLAVLCQQANLQRSDGTYERARSIHEDAITLARANGLSHHVVMADHLIGLADIAKAHADVEQAESLRRQGLNIYRERLGPSSKRVLALQ